MCASVNPANSLVVREDEGVNVLQHLGVCWVIEEEPHPLEEVLQGSVPRDVPCLILQVEAQFKGQGAIDCSSPRERELYLAVGLEQLYHDPTYLPASKSENKPICEKDHNSTEHREIKHLISECFKSILNLQFFQISSQTGKINVVRWIHEQNHTDLGNSILNVK